MYLCSYTARLVLLCISIAFASFLAIDMVVDMLIPWLKLSYLCRVSSDIVVIDLTGSIKIEQPNTRVVHLMTVNDFRCLGCIKAKHIIIVGHGYSVKRALTLPLNTFALETSETPSILVVISHPLLVLSEAIVKGCSDSICHIAVTPRIFLFTIPIKFESVVLVTCGMGNVKNFAEEIHRAGARVVIYSAKSIAIDDVPSIVKEIVRILTTKGPCYIPKVLHVFRSIGCGNS